MHPQSVADGTGIIEWNIDGMDDVKIYNELQELVMKITACKWKNATDKQATNKIIAGFTCTLRNWWDNYLIEKKQKRNF